MRDAACERIAVINAAVHFPSPISAGSLAMSLTKAAATQGRPQLAPGKVVRIVFIALVCDLLAFTMPCVARSPIA